MTESESTVFYNSALRFQVRIPPTWRFLPPAWSPVEQMKRAIDDRDDWIHFANKPFCCAMRHHDSRLHAYPTLQVTVRPCPTPDNATIAAILEAQRDLLSQQYEGFRELQATADAIVAGHRALSLRTTFTLPTMPDDALVPISVLARLRVVFALNRAYTVGLSSSADAAYFDETEFDGIVASVRIGQ